MMHFNLLAFLLILLGFGLLAVSMPRHYRDIRPGRAAPSVALSRLYCLAGFFMLSVVCVWYSQSHGLALGLVYWTGQLTLAALLLSILLSYCPQRLLHLLSVALVGAVGLMSL